MYKPSTSLVVVTYFPTYLSIYEAWIFPTELVTKVKPNVNSVEVHPQPSNNRHPMDGALVRGWVLLVHGLQNPIFWSVVDEECGFQLIDCLRKPHSSSMEEALSQLSHPRGLVCCLPGFSFTWNPIGKEKEENKHRKQRVCCPLQSHPCSNKIGRSSEHFFLAAKLIIIILASPAALEQ
jgi:hypothetical protein